MAKKIIREGSTTFHMDCPECGTYFTYESEDVRHNYVRGGEWVTCPFCAHACRHFGASARWDGCGGRRSRSGHSMMCGTTHRGANWYAAPSRGASWYEACGCS